MYVHNSRELPDKEPQYRILCLPFDFLPRWAPKTSRPGERHNTKSGRQDKRANGKKTKADGKNETEKRELFFAAAGIGALCRPCPCSYHHFGVESSRRPPRELLSFLDYSNVDKDQASGCALDPR